MNEHYYTVEKAAKIIGMHPKTVRRFIREGKLKANKVGKEWRITGHDLSVFVEGGEKATAKKPQMFNQNREAINRDNTIKVSAVADIDVSDIDEAMRIANTMTAIMNSKDPSFGKATITTQYLESESKVRVMLWGNTSFIEAMMGSLNALTGGENE